MSDYNRKMDSGSGRRRGRANDSEYSRWGLTDDEAKVWAFMKSESPNPKEEWSAWYGRPEAEYETMAASVEKKLQESGYYED